MDLIFKPNKRPKKRWVRSGISYLYHVLILFGPEYKWQAFTICSTQFKLQKQKNEELNNKIDLEIRILDGILKLLNAICLSPITNSLATSTLQLGTNHAIAGLNSASSNSTSSSSSSSSSQSASSILINNFDPAKYTESNKYTVYSYGSAIAAAVISNKSSGESSSTNGANSLQSSSNSLTSTSSSMSNTSSNTVANTNTFDSNSAEYNHIFQILTACKCLFVSHRKIAIYLENLNEIEAANKKMLLLSDSSSNENEENIENVNSISESASDMNGKISDVIESDTCFLVDTCKLMLSDLRVPLSWKWSDYLKASKNSGNSGFFY